VADLVFANFAEAVAEGRGKAQPMRCGRAKTEHMASVIDWQPGAVNPKEEAVRRPSCSRARTWSSRRADHPGDGDVFEGIASVDESAAIRGSRRRSSGNRVVTAAR